MIPSRFLSHSFRNWHPPRYVTSAHFGMCPGSQGIKINLAKGNWFRGGHIFYFEPEDLAAAPALVVDQYLLNSNSKPANSSALQCPVIPL